MKQQKQQSSAQKIFRINPLTAIPFQLSRRSNTVGTFMTRTPKATDISQPSPYRFELK